MSPRALAGGDTQRSAVLVRQDLQVASETVVFVGKPANSLMGVAVAARVIIVTGVGDFSSGNTISVDKHAIQTQAQLTRFFLIL